MDPAEPPRPPPATRLGRLMYAHRPRVAAAAAVFVVAVTAVATVSLVTSDADPADLLDDAAATAFEITVPRAGRIRVWRGSLARAGCPAAAVTATYDATQRAGRTEFEWPDGSRIVEIERRDAEDPDAGRWRLDLDSPPAPPCAPEFTGFGDLYGAGPSGATVGLLEQVGIPVVRTALLELAAADPGLGLVTSDGRDEKNRPAVTVATTDLTLWVHPDTLEVLQAEMAGTRITMNDDGWEFNAAGAFDIAGFQPLS